MIRRCSSRDVNAVPLLPTLLGLLLLVVRDTSAGVDPWNATALRLTDTTTTTTTTNNGDSEEPSAIYYNVTHTYFRDALAELNVAWNRSSSRCIRTSPVHTIGYWINEFELPGELRYIDRDGLAVRVHGVERVSECVDRLMQRLSDELALGLRRIDMQQYYTMLRRLMLEPGRRFQGLLPIQVHFRVKPYPQSSFGEFVSDRSLVWETYHPAVYASHAGRKEDLLYRLRHNFRHSLGLGHRDDRRSIMFPTNVLGLAEVDRLDNDAVHRLLCDPNAVIKRNRYDDGDEDEKRGQRSSGGGVGGTTVVRKVSRPLTLADVQRLAFSERSMVTGRPSYSDDVVVLRPRSGGSPIGL